MDYVPGPGVRTVSAPTYVRFRLLDPATIWGGILAGFLAIIAEYWFRHFVMNRLPRLQIVYPPAQRKEA